ncbi:hypothetical protein [Arthrobacter globiformis]|uniref:hypothetical protein n=1 Tax=Arthrobacter globiformis TaxID=1665 RepID=UPI0027918F87|nr:hypothetical protein [Arthrobacter globiformis]MDQ0619208.1 hypothetical protein [Arthrobacter globiformis]
MMEPSLEPTPRGWIEKAYDANVFTMLTVALLVPVLYPLNDKVGYWLSLVITALAVAALSVLVALPVIPIKRRRAALDAERGFLNAPIGRSGPRSSKDGPSDMRKQNPGGSCSKPRLG